MGICCCKETHDIDNAICQLQTPNIIAEENNLFSEQSELQRRVNDLTFNDPCENNDESNRPIESMKPFPTFAGNENPKKEIQKGIQYPKRKKRKKKKKRNRPIARVSFNTKFIPAQLKFASKRYLSNERRYNENWTSNTINNTKFTNVVPPPKMLTKDDFMMTWQSWKNKFLIYMKSIDQSESNKQRWGLMLLNRMGPIGQKIYKTFTFDKDNPEEDIDVLIKKFDFYYIFENMRRGQNQEIDKYVNDLTTIAAKYTTNTDEIVKEKILMEVDKDKFTKKAQSLFPEFSFPSSVQSLNIKDLTNIWMSYES